jgi:hypothetical protein
LEGNGPSLSQKDGGGPPHVVSPLVVAGRALLLLAAAAALVFGFVRAQSHDREIAAMAQQYVCPMHPGIKSHAPGDCPICNMALVPMTEVLSEGPKPGSANDERVLAVAQSEMVARAVRAAAWVGADGVGKVLLYKDDLVGAAAEEPARFFGRLSPNMPFGAHLISAEQTPRDVSTVEVAFRLDHPSEHARGGAGPLDVGSLQLDGRARKLLVIPSSAVLYSARGPYVLVRGAGEEFEKRAVQVGRILDSGYLGAQAGMQSGSTVILSGLREGETVISGYTFFKDVDRRLREVRVSSAQGETQGETKEAMP